MLKLTILTFSAFNVAETERNEPETLSISTVWRNMIKKTICSLRNK